MAINEFVNRMASDWTIHKKRKDDRRRNAVAGLKHKGFNSNIEKDTLKNNDFRRVLYTAKNAQLVLMSLNPGEEIGAEIHSNVDQFFRIESGEGVAIINGRRIPITNGSAIVVPAGSLHNVINVGRTDLKLYTLYSPPHHKDGVVRHTKAQAEAKANAESFNGRTTE